MQYGTENLKYGVTLPDGTDFTAFTPREAAGEARAFFIVARGCLISGEAVRLYSENSQGARVTLDRAKAN